jgi:DAK2 domain fusion protein YloV
MAAVCKAISHGSLMGARGNSGVILSQILRGLATTFAESETCDAARLADGLVAAAAGAYGAVMRPIEGTILTVIRELSEAAKATAGNGGSLVEVLDAARAAGQVALEGTPDLLPVLKEAGVVDAGGAGLLLLLDAALHVVDGRPVPAPEPVSSVVLVAAGHPVQEHGHGDVSDLRYEVMYFLEAPDETIPAFKDVWAGIGDSIVVVGGDGIWNCHIHTDDIGASIEAALDCGRPKNIRVTDLMEQVEEERWVREAPVEAPVDLTPVPTAVVAVATGDGIRRIFISLGVQSIVVGGQTMNPSTAQLLESVEAAPADEVVILPNNKNIIPVAEQVDALTSKTVRVLRTTSITEGFAALLEYDPQASADSNVAAMTEAFERITSGEVTRAVRDSTWSGGSVAEGDFIGLTDEGIVAVGSTVDEAAIGLLDAMVGESHEIVTIIEGEGATAGTTRRLTEWLAESRPGVSPEVHHGGQPLYPYLLAVE